MTIEEWALEKRKLLQAGKISPAQVAREINELKLESGATLTIPQKERILGHIEFGKPVKGQYPAMEGDNSAWIKAVATIRASVDGVRKK